jgi:hypothetical protein
MGSRLQILSVVAVLALALYGFACVFRDVSALHWTPIKTYAFHDHIIQVRSYPDGWWRKYETMIDDWEDVLAGYDSPDDAFRAAQAHIKQMDKEVQE